MYVIASQNHLAQQLLEMLQGFINLIIIIVDNLKCYSYLKTEYLVEQVKFELFQEEKNK